MGRKKGDREEQEHPDFQTRMRRALGVGPSGRADAGNMSKGRVAMGLLVA